MFFVSFILIVIAPLVLSIVIGVFDGLESIDSRYYEPTNNRFKRYNIFFSVPRRITIWLFEDQTQQSNKEKI